MDLFKILNRKKEDLNDKKETTDISSIETYIKHRGETNMSNPLIDLSEVELRDLCRHYIDTFEKWSRRLIDETLKREYGVNYFDFITPEGQPLVKKEIKKRVETRIQNEPCRYPRKIDAVLLEDIEYFLCRDDLYGEHFKTVLEPFYSGVVEIRKVLERLVSIRNKLSHNNTISLHEAEQCLCYTGDFVEVYKQYYVSQGREKEYNVPVFLRLKDCLGNDVIRNDSSYSWEIYSNAQTGPMIQLRSGDEYKLWVEVDSSFDSSFYEVKWRIEQMFGTIARGSGTEIKFRPSNKNVSYSPTIEIFLKTKRDWHRFGKVDDIVKLNLNEILPPIEDI